MIKVIQRIPTDQYAYIEMEIAYDSVEDAFIDHERLLKLHEGGTGLDTRTWKKVREKMLNIGENDPNLHEEMNKAQRWFINELKLTLRALKAEEPTIN